MTQLNTMATGNNRDKITSTMDEEGIPYDDPRFVEILEACLHVEIAAYKESYGKTQAEIRKIKRNVLMKLEKRKELKKKIEDAEDVISMSNVTLRRLREDVRETKQRIELIEANADDRSKLMSYEMQRYREILDEYKKTWQSYHTEYEDFPLAKKRKERETELKKVCIEKMVLEFKLNELKIKCEQKKKIDEIRTRLKIIELAKAMVNNEKLERKLVDLRNEIDHCKRQLHSRELELKSLQRREEEDRKERAMKLLEMPPPKINLSRVRLNYSRKWQDLEIRKKMPPVDSDSMSVNTIALEEMCISDDITAEDTGNKDLAISISMDDRKRSTNNLFFDYEIKEKGTRDPKSTENFAVATSLQKTQSKMLASFSSNAESIAKQTSFKGKDEQKRSTMPVDAEEECAINYEENRFPNDLCQPKRMKFVRNDEKDGEHIDIELSQTSKRSTRYPRITKIEKVQYGVTSLTKRKNVLLDASKSFLSSNNFDYETNASRATSFMLNEALMIKDLNDSKSAQPSMYDDNSRNFELSDCANASNIPDIDINMESVDVNCEKIDRQEDEKEASPQVTPRFNFSDLLKLKTDNNFRIF
ncbi:spindle pole body component 110-like [Vespa crabro]|uniref:spindle pole body component 110-like n=1 Tax=Vespa crabro TaxID=7445 RepID=UPI001F000AF7|nr:spindle pole body component 110-like [Vespa crabro]XP_046822505.1 spindle pole body component 110-like [Vespa crabro]XP_046822506.1 spindle pole body component 110-like [Vespa crabro]